MAKLIEKVYAQALLKLAVEEDKVIIFSEEVKAVKQALAENKELGKLMKHPDIAKQEKEKILENIWDGRISREVIGLMLLLLEKGHYEQVPLVFDYFLKKAREIQRIGIAYIKTAILLSEEQREKVRERLLETTSYHTLEAHFDVDESIIGGMIIRIDNRVLDSSIKTRLKKLSRKLYQLKI